MLCCVVGLVPNLRFHTWFWRIAQAAPAAKVVAKKTGPTKKAVHFTIELKRAVDDKVLVVSDYVSGREKRPGNSCTG